MNGTESAGCMRKVGSNRFTSKELADLLPRAETLEEVLQAPIPIRRIIYIMLNEMSSAGLVHTFAPIRRTKSVHLSELNLRLGGSCELNLRHMEAGAKSTTRIFPLIATESCEFLHFRERSRLTHTILSRFKGASGTITLFCRGSNLRFGSWLPDF